jgi:hypothetical protein
MSTWVEAPPQPKRGLGCCLGKGCLILIVFSLLLAVTFVVGGYIGARHAFTSTAPRQLPLVPTSEEQQQAVLQRWDNFENKVRNPEAPPPPSESSPQPQTGNVTPAQPAAPTIDFTAADINQLIAANRKARGKAFVSIENNVGRVAVSIPLSKVGLRGRYLNADFEVRSSPDGDPRKIQVTMKSLRGVQVPERVFNLILGSRSLRGYLDSYISEYRSEYGISKFEIADNKVILQATAGR